MAVLRFSNAHDFLQKTRRFLFNDEISHNLVLSSVLTLSKSPLRGLTFFAACGEDGAVEGVALKTPQHRWVVSQTTSRAAEHLAREIVNHEGNQKKIRSLTVPNQFANAFEDLKGPRMPNSLHYMACSRLKPLDAAPGLMRLARAPEFKTLERWSALAAKEGDIDETLQEGSALLKRYLDSRQLFVWENDGQIRAMATIGGFTPKSIRISQVYTEEKSRGRGYASALVHRLTHRLLNEQPGVSCILLVDSENTRAIRIYEKLGYREISQFAELRPLSVTTTG